MTAIDEKVTSKAPEGWDPDSQAVWPGAETGNPHFTQSTRININQNVATVRAGDRCAWCVTTLTDVESVEQNRHCKTPATRGPSSFAERSWTISWRQTVSKGREWEEFWYRYPPRAFLSKADL